MKENSDDSQKDEKEYNHKNENQNIESIQNELSFEEDEESEKDKISNNKYIGEKNNKNEEMKLKLNESNSSFSLKPKYKNDNNSKNSLDRADSEKEENIKKDEKEQKRDKNSEKENEKESKEEEEEEDEDREDEEEEEDKEEEKDNSKNKKFNNKNEDSIVDNESEKNKKEINLKKIKINQEYNSNFNTKTLKSIFSGKITEESSISDYQDAKGNGIDINILSVIYLKILLNDNEDPSLIFNRKKYQIILDNIEKNLNYFEIYKNLKNNEPTNLNELLKINKKNILNPILINVVNPNEQMEVEFYKYGKTFSSSIRKRFGIIINTNFYSSTKPLEKFNDKKAKNKTKYILYSKDIVKENLEGNENNYDKKKNIWHNEEKGYRIKINYLTDKNKMSSFFIYCEDEKERDEIYLLIKLTQMSLNIKDASNIVLKQTQKAIKNNYSIYGIIKILAVKKKLKNKNSIKKYLNNNIL